jgi:hypothetical protein
MGKIDECDRDGIYCSAIGKINKTAQPGERVFLASYQRYWLRGDLLQCLGGIPAGVIGDQFWLELYKEGLSFVFIDKTTHAASLEILDIEHHPDWVVLTQLFDKSELLIYHMDYINPPTAVVPMRCENRPSSTIWEVVSP